MRYIDIGAKGGSLSLSRLSLGASQFGTSIGMQMAAEAAELYLSRGGNCFDSARIYGAWAPDGDGACDKAVGELIKRAGKRGNVIVSGKGAHPLLSEMERSRVSYADIRQDLHESLALMDTDYIDIYFLHRDDERVPVGEIIDWLNEFIGGGLIRAIGASNWSTDRIFAANEYAAKNGKQGFTVAQQRFSLTESNAKAGGDPTMVELREDDYRRYRQRDLPVMAYSSQARGYFAKLAAGADVSRMAGMFDTELNRRRFEALQKICAREGWEPAGVALAYLTQNQLPVSAIIGFSRIEQLEASMRAEAEVNLTAEDLADLQIWP